MKRAVILFNLGGACCPSGVKPFLFNLFSDPAIIGLPNPFRTWLASFISSRREHEARDIYNQIGGGSPILANTYAQAKALESELATLEGRTQVFLCMRYSYPRIDDTLAQLAEYKPDEVVFLSLYPQYSTTTVSSSVKEWNELALDYPNARIIESYHDDELFIASYSDLLQNAIQGVENPIILFSAHGIPLNRIKRGDPYQIQIEESSRLIMEKLNAQDCEYQVCYQSKVGPLKWLEPSTEQLVRKYSAQNRNIVVLPISFVSEHSETLVELDIQYKQLAMECGAKSYIRVPTVSVHPLFIKCLAGKVL